MNVGSVVVEVVVVGDVVVEGLEDEGEAMEDA